MIFPSILPVFGLSFISMELVIFAAFAAVFIQSDNMFPDLRNHEQEIIAKHLKCHYNQGQQPITESVAIFVAIFIDVFVDVFCQ